MFWYPLFDFCALRACVVHNVGHKTSVNSLSAIFDEEARMVCKVLSQKYSLRLDRRNGYCYEAFMLSLFLFTIVDG